MENNKCYFCGAENSKPLEFSGNVIAHLCETCVSFRSRPIIAMPDYGMMVDLKGKYVLTHINTSWDSELFPTIIEPEV
jgi:hypothetical protein